MSVKFAKWLSFTALLMLAPIAHATIIYDWSGTCNVGCGGTATASLYLDDSYVPGSAITSFNFSHTTPIQGLDLYMPAMGGRPAYSASFTSHDRNFYGTVSDPLWLPLQSGTGAGTIFSFGGYMATTLSMAWDGSWQFGEGMTMSSVCSEALAPGGCGGTASQWVRRSVPLPGTAFLLALGLAVMAVPRLRKRWQSSLVPLALTTAGTPHLRRRPTANHP